MSVNIQTSSGLVKIAGTPTIDNALSNVSKNPVQNKVVTEKINEINSNLSVIGKCKNLLNPTLQTTTQNGVTCTNNGDGTYTLNGTASSQTTFVFAQLKASNLFKNGITYKFCGCPKLGNSIWFVVLI